MKNRLITTIKDISKKKGKMFCAFITLGYPDLKSTEKLILEFEKSGVDIIELGIPFSDPMADGPTIQFSSEFALKQNVSLHDAFHLVKNLRLRGCKVPIICFTYLNPVYHFGLQTFPLKAKESGFDGVLIPDMPPEEEKEFQKECKKNDLSHIFLVTPTTRSNRAELIDRATSGFIYYVSLRGVTGARQAFAADVSKEIAAAKKNIKNPMLIGFGISTPEQGKSMTKLSEGVIVGSAIIDKIRSSNHSIEPAISFVQDMVSAVKGRGHALPSRS